MTRIRRLFVCSALLFVPLVTICPSVKAQGCRVIHSENLGVPSTAIVLPSEVNGVAATNDVYASNVSGSTPSQNITITPGTQVGIDVTTYHAQSRSWYFTRNGGPPQGQGSVSGFSGTQTWTNPNAWLANSGDVGDTITFYNTAYDGLNETGNSSQVRLMFSVVSGNGPSVIFQDDFPTSYYEMLQNNFNGTTSMNFEYCPGAATATHYAPFFGTLTNPTTGESAFFDTSIAFRPNGGYNEEVPPTYVSFLPGDKPPQTSTTGRVMCTIAGDFVGLIAATGDNTKNQRIDKKMWTKVKIATTVQAGDGGWYVDQWCLLSPKQVPIWAPNEVYTSLAPLNQYYWTAQTCSSSPEGTDPGPGWHCPGIAGGPGPGSPENFFPSLTSARGGCNTLVNTPAPY